ncbi:MAG: TadE/TadG family type IV pilus assembly protein [Pseudomonadota bacterium]
MRDDSRGAVLIEFALVYPVFLILVFTTAEYSYYLFKRNFAKHVLYETSRTIQTGEIQFADDPEAIFQLTYCEFANVLLDCNKVFFDVRSYAELSDATFPAATFSAAGHPTNFVFEPGDSEEITVMRVSTPHEFVTPWMRTAFQADGAPAIVIGYTIVKNEPFGCTQSCD